jgi:mannose PTS system EIIA component
MASILLVAHTPLASALASVAQHAYSDCGGVRAVDVPPGASLEQARALVDAAIAALPAGEVLILADAFGATPCNAAIAAIAASDGQRSRVVAGVNVPMLWRTLCYASLPLAELATRAADGARSGVVQAAPTGHQNQPKPPTSHDSDAHPDQ